MSNTTKRGNVGGTPFHDYSTKRGAASTAQVFYANSMIGINTSGYADKMDDAAVKRFDGVLSTVDAEVLSGGSNGDVLLDVSQPRYITVAIAAAVAADVGRVVYASDDQTVALTPGTYGNVVGRIVEVLSATLVRVECIYADRTGGGVPLQILSANGAIQIKSGTVLITKGSIAAITLANPTAGTDDGKELEIVTTTAFAHVVTEAADGFNAKGSSGTASFAAAAGNSFRIIAYQGHWYTVGGLAGVTIA